MARPIGHQAPKIFPYLLSQFCYYKWATVPGSFIGVGDLNLGPPVCTANSLPTEPFT